MKKKDPPIQDYEDFRQRVMALPKDQQIKVLTKAYDMIYEHLDDKVWRTMATAIKYAKESGLEGSESIDVADKDLKKLTHIQESASKRKEE